MGGKARKPFPPWQSSRKDDRLNILNYADSFRSISLFKRHAKILVSFVHAAVKGSNESTENISKRRSGMQR